MKDTVCMYQRVMGCDGASHEPIAVCDPEIPKIAALKELCVISSRHLGTRKGTYTEGKYRYYW